MVEILNINIPVSASLETKEIRTQKKTTTADIDFEWLFESFWMQLAEKKNQTLHLFTNQPSEWAMRKSNRIRWF